jgi:hypothetical protein
MASGDDAPTLQGKPEVAPAFEETADEAAYTRALRAELDRRLAALAAAPDDAFGAIGVGDGALVALAFVLLPALLVWLNR